MIRRARLRLTLWYAGIFIVMLLALGAAAYWTMARSLDDEVDRGVQTVVDSWRSTAPDLATLRPLDLERHFEGDTADVFLLVFRADGTLLANPSELEAEEFLEEGLVEAALRGAPVWDTVEEHGERLRVLAAPIVQDGAIAGVVIGGRSLATYERQLGTLLAVLGGVAVVGLGMSVVGGYVVAGRALRPVASAYERQRAFVGDASHELRSPLAVIRASSELLLRDGLNEAQREAVEEILDTSVEATELVEHLLELARIERSRVEHDPAPCDVAGVVDDLVEHLSPLLEEHGTSVTRRGESLVLRFDERDLRRVLRALLDNVLAHTPRGTGVTVEVAREDGTGVIRLRDDGPGVPERAVETIFEPFTRLDAARTPASGHAGLGLAIAHRLVQRNRAQIQARNHPDGGLEFTLRARTG